MAGEPFPIHGNGFACAWTVESASDTAVELSLSSDGPAPFRYAAQAAYELEAGALTMRIRISNMEDDPLPYGLGLHPWIVRTPDVTLQAPATTVCLEGPDHLPAGAAAVTSRPDWNFERPRGLPADWINNGFLGWGGRADVVWPDRKLALEIAAAPPLERYILYSPSGAADFFCFEPVTHGVDAHNAPGGPEANGLAVLEPGGSLSIACRFSPRRIDDASRPSPFAPGAARNA